MIEWVRRRQPDHTVDDWAQCAGRFQLDVRGHLRGPRIEPNQMARDLAARWVLSPHVRPDSAAVGEQHLRTPAELACRRDLAARWIDPRNDDPTGPGVSPGQNPDSLVPAR